MENQNFSESLRAFAKEPCAKTAFAFIQSCKGFVCSQAAKWHESNLSFADKIKEIISEMLLILLEEFDLSKLVHENTVFKYLYLRIQQLTRPQRSKMFFTDNFDAADQGRCSFSASKLQLTNEIASTVKSFLLSCKDQNVLDLEFLFIHVYPETAWISRLLAGACGTDADQQAVNDRQRHFRFNNGLRNALRDLRFGDLSEISEWSRGERSHLAWRMINIAPAEISSGCETDRQLLDAWRENIDKSEPQPVENLAAARRICADMKKLDFCKLPFEAAISMAAEEPVPYGAPTDILSRLLGQRQFDACAAEEEKEELHWTDADPNSISEAKQAVYDQAANELSVWFDALIKQKQKNDKLS